MKHGHVNAWAGTFATNVLILLIGLATGILFPRLLGPEGRGALATVIFWPALCTSIGLFDVSARGKCTTIEFRAFERPFRQS